MMINNSEKGLALYLTFIVLVVVLASVLGVAAIFLRQMAMIERLEDSVIAFLAADTGIERELDLGTTPPASDYEYLDLNKNGVFGDGADSRYDVKVIAPGVDGCAADNFCIRSIGTFKKVRRAIEVRR